MECFLKNYKQGYTYIYITLVHNEIQHVVVRRQETPPNSSAEHPIYPSKYITPSHPTKVLYIRVHIFKITPNPLGTEGARV